jgi:predicted alpha/beta hydrolase
MSKPSILLIPGSFALPEFYDPVVNAVSAKGYSIQALHLPTVGPKIGPVDAEPPSMYADAAFIAQEIEKLADEGKDVILIGHSYGGVPLSESTKGLGKDEREKEGKKGGVVRLGYLTALVPPVGTSAAGVLAGVPEEFRLNLQMDVRFSPFLSSTFDNC